MTTVLSSTNLTLLDWAKRLAPDGSVPEVAELLTQTNEILLDAVAKPGNLPTGDRVTIRTGLPTAYYRAINQGIPNSKSTTAQVDEGCSMIEARSEIDTKLAALNGNTGTFRASEDVSFIEAINQAHATGMFYGDPRTDPKEFLGLAARYGSLSAGNSQNVISCTGNEADGNTSIYLVGWGDNTVYCPFPKGSSAGITHDDLGEQTIFNSDGTRLQAFASRFVLETGLVVKDWRYAGRICNIETDDLINMEGTQAAAAATHIIKAMLKMAYRIPNLSACRPAFYMNRTVHEGLAMAAMEKSSSVLRINEAMTQYGTPTTWLSFLGIPLRKCDAILNTEAVVS